MHTSGISRRQAGQRILALAALAALPAPALAFQAGGGRQPASGRKASILESFLKPARTKDWTFKTWVTVRGYQNWDNNTVTIIPLEFETAAAVFPVIKGCASSEVYTPEVTAGMYLNDRLVTDKPEFAENYHAGTRLAVLKTTSASVREMELRLEVPMTCFETVFDEAAASKFPWPTAPWPAEAASTLGPDPLVIAGAPIVDAQSPEIVALVKRWIDVKDPAEIKKKVGPVRLAKGLAGYVQEHVQPSGDGLNFSKMGLLEGVALQPASFTARTARGTEHDMANMLAAVYRCAGLPARTVIGYDVVDKKGSDTKFLSRSRGGAKLRSWVEFAMYDEGGNKLLWVPVDVNRMRRSGSRMQPMTQPWKYFGSHDELDDIMPFAFHFHPPAQAAVAHGSPAFWGWLTTPRTQQAFQMIRFESQTTPRSVERQRERQRYKEEKERNQP